MTTEVNGLVARNADLEQELVAARKALESMQIQLQEERAAKDEAMLLAKTLNSDLQLERQGKAFWRAECQKMIVDRTYVTA